MKKTLYMLLVIFIPMLIIASENKIQIKDIKIIGSKRISVKTISFYIKLKPGDYVDNDDVDLVIKDLYKTKLFMSVNAHIDEKKDLVINIQDNPLINKVILQGNKLFNDKELLTNVVRSKSLNILTETKLQSDLMNLVTTYRNNGKIGVKVEHELITLDENRVNLIFKINEGKTSKIKNIRFIGNKNFSEDQLGQIIKTPSTNIFSKLFQSVFNRKNYYSPQYLLIITELLDRFYSSNGYINNSIRPIVEVDNNYQVHATFLIDEGQQYLFGNNKVSIENKAQDLNLEKEVLQCIVKKDNQIFNRLKINDEVEKISKHLNDKGYVFAKINPEYTQHDNIVDITYRLLPGKRIYVNNIIINGNERTFDQVIRSKLNLSEGDAYNVLEIQKSYKKLISSDFFSSVKIDNYAISDNAVNLNVNVKEKRTGVFSLAGGMSFPGGVFFKTDIKEPNLFGSGKELSFAFEKSQYSLLTDIEFIENNFNDSETSIGGGIFHERHESPNSNFSSINSGFSAKLSYKVIDHLTNSFRYFYKYNNVYKDKKVDTNIISAVGYTLTYNKLDNMYSPQDGYLFHLSQDISGLGGTVNFIKSEFLSFFVRPILSKLDDDITLHLKMGTGYIFSYTDKNLGIDQRFFKEIRGFDLSGIGPRDKEKNSLGGKFYFNATQQIDFPLPKLYDHTGIKGSLFIDLGTLFGLECEKDECKDMYKDNKLLRVSTGFGFSMPSPFGGRLRLDFGFPLVKEDYDKMPSPNIKFSIETGV